MVLTALTQVPFALFQAFEKMEYVSLGRILTSVLLLISLVPAIRYGYGAVGFA